MKAVIIGSGNVAWQLASHFGPSGIELVQLVNLHGGVIPPAFDRFQVARAYEPEAVYPKADIYIVAISDSAISELRFPVLSNEQVIAHTAGSVPIDVLSKLGDNFGCVYPLQSFSIGLESNLREVPLLIESSNVYTRERLQMFAERLSEKVSYMDGDQRRDLHLAAVMVNNFSNHLYALAEKFLSERNISFELLHPLMSETLRKIQSSSAAEAQTGPARRGDEKTLKMHEMMLRAEENILNIYKIFSDSIQRFYKS